MFVLRSPVAYTAADRDFIIPPKATLQSWVGRERTRTTVVEREEATDKEGEEKSCARLTGFTTPGLFFLCLLLPSTSFVQPPRRKTNQPTNARNK